MKIGFTGTRNGMTPAQKHELYCILSSKISPDSPWSYFHHGCCIGSDFEAHQIAAGLRLRIVGHPPDDVKLAVIPSDCWDLHPGKPFLDRNKDIVKCSELLIACPEGFGSINRSGTWSTIRCAQREGKKIIIIYPDGTTDET